MRLHKRSIQIEALENRVLLAGVPVILKVSDAVEAGNSFNINGGGIDAGTVDVALTLDTTGAPAATPPVNALHPQILQTDKDGTFVVVKAPVGLTPGVYDVWVKNASGWSSPTTMNAARALFQSEYQAYAGLNIEVVGRNFNQTEFGGISATQVRLNNGAGGLYSQTIASLNPYNVTFTVGAAAPVGTYFVEVSNDGGVHWSRPSSGQTLSIIAHTGTDPLGLGVSWAQDFKWGNVIDVTKAPYNINPADTSGDDTAAIQNAVNAAQSAGGGIVYFPNGNYYSSSISVGAGVVLEGQDEFNTRLYYNGRGGWVFISSKGSGSLGGVAQLQGIARISVLLKDQNIRPDVFMYWGDVNAPSNEALWTANRIIITNVNLNYDLTSGFANPSYVVNDNAAGVSYTGAWTYATGHTGDTNSDIHTTTPATATTTDSFQYTFTGTSVLYYGERGPTCGNVDIYLDGIYKATVNGNSSTTQPASLIYNATSTTWGTHTLKVVNHDAGKTMTLDSLTVLTPRGIGTIWNAHERVVMQNNNFVGWYADNAITYLYQYFTCRNNNYEFSAGYVHDTANYAFFENNTINIHPEYNQDTHGIFARSDAYVSGNYVQGAGDASNVNNDGEGICNEPPNGNYNYGAVSSATATTLVVAAKIPLTVPVPYYGDVSVMITYGTGKGQVRKATNINPATNTITVDSPFAIVPNSTSTFTLDSPLLNFTVYKNTVVNCASGILPYGNQFDAVVADNTLNNTVGIFLWAARSSNGTTSANNTADAFVRIARNTLTGVSRRSQTSAISVYTGRFDGKAFYDTMAYGTEIIDNTITGDLTQVPNGKLYFAAYNGIYISSYLYSNMSDGSGTGDAANIIIDGNHLSQLQAGIMLTKGDYGQVISNNTTDASVVQLLRDGGSQNTLLTPDNFSPRGFNITSQGTLTTSTLNPLSAQGSTDINLIHDGITPQLSPANDGSWDDQQPFLQFDNKSTASPYTQYYGYTFSASRTFSKLVFVDGRHYSDGGWFANGSLKVQVRQSGVWVDVPATSVHPYPNSNSQAAFGTGFQAYDFLLNNVSGDGIRITGTAGGSAHYASISELEAWALPAAPSAAALQINDGLAQRSMIKTLTVTFDQAVSLASDALALALRGGTIGFTTLIANPSGDGKTYVLSFTGAGITAGSLPDGIFDLTVNAASVTDAYGQTLTGGNRTFTFHRLFGDFNGNKQVNNADLLIFRSTYFQSTGSPTFLWYADWNGSGIVNNLDTLKLKNNYLRTFSY